MPCINCFCRPSKFSAPRPAQHGPIPAISILSIGPGYYPHYHHPSDLPEHVDWQSVEACTQIALGTLRAFDRRLD